MAVSGGEGLSSAHPCATLPPRERSSAAHPKVGLSAGGGLSAAQPRGGLSPRGLSSAAVPARAAAPAVRGAAASLEPRAAPGWRRMVGWDAWRGMTGGPRGMWSGEGVSRQLSSGESRQVCTGERGSERGEDGCEAPLASSGGTSAAAAAAAAAAAMGEKEEVVGGTQALRVSYEGERGRLGATAHATGGEGTRQEAPRPGGRGV